MNQLSPRRKQSIRKPGRPSGAVEHKSGLIQAAITAFSEKGFEGTSVREVAEVAGVTSAAVLHHYTSKNELYRLVMEEISHSLETRHVLSNPGRRGPSAIKAVVGDVIDWVVEYPDYAKIAMRDVLDNSERIKRAKKWPLRPGMHKIHTAFRTAMGSKDDDPEPELLALQVLGAAFLFYSGIKTHEAQALAPTKDWACRFRENLIRSALGVYRRTSER